MIQSKELFEEEISPLDIVGYEILQRVFLRNPAVGGVFLEVSGVQGSGKTSCLFDITNKIMEKNPDELVFMRDRVNTPVQFNRYPRWRIMAEEGLELKFRDIQKDKYLEIPVTYFKNYEDLYRKAKPGYINVVYFNNERKQWFKFISYLRRTMHRRGHMYLNENIEEPVWKTVIWDEYEDLCPADEEKPLWTMIKNFKDEAKNIRKGLVTLLVDTQNKWDVDYRVRGKLMMRVYLKGAAVDKNSPINQKAINALDQIDGKRQALIDWGARYGKIRFNPYPPRKPLFEVII